MKDKIIVWGIGATYNQHVNVLKYYEQNNWFGVMALTATFTPPYKYIDGYIIIDKETLSQMQFDYLIVMSGKYYNEIMYEAMQLGVKREQILPYRILDIPGLNWKEYIGLKNSRISIVSNNCWGGVAYHTLGWECLSPFKNLFLEDNDYLELLSDLDYYLSREPVFVRYSTEVHSRKIYPILAIDNVQIHCNHDTDKSVAIFNWNRRCKKINKQNLFVEMYTENEEIAGQFAKLDQFPKRVCFVPFKTDNPYLFTLELMKGQVEFWEAVNSHASTGNNSLKYRLLDLLDMRGSDRTVSPALYLSD